MILAMDGLTKIYPVPADCPCETLPARGVAADPPHAREVGLAREQLRRGGANSIVRWLHLDGANGRAFFTDGSIRARATSAVCVVVARDVRLVVQTVRRCRLVVVLAAMERCAV